MKEKQVKREEITAMKMNQVKDLTLDLKQLLPLSLSSTYSVQDLLCLDGGSEQKTNKQIF